MNTYSQEELLKLLEKKQRTVSFKKQNGDTRIMEGCSIQAAHGLSAPVQRDVQGLITVASVDGYRSFYADSVLDVE